MDEITPGRVRVGGQALPDGVLMRTDRAWAIARADGTLVSGAMPHQVLAQVPVLRVLTGMIPALVIGLTGGRPDDGNGLTRQRRPSWGLIRGLVIAETGVIGASWLAQRADLPRSIAPVVSLAMLGLAIGLLRAASPSRQ